MSEWVLRKIGSAAITAAISSVAIFLLIRVLPGDPAKLILEGRGIENVGASISGHTLDSLRVALGLDRPLPLQYLSWIVDAAQFDLGRSLATDQPVRTELMERFPVTLEISILGILVALGVGLVIGGWGAVTQRRSLQHALRMSASLTIALPSFWFALMCILAISSVANWAPTLDHVPFLQSPMENLAQLALPALCLGLPASGQVARITRATVASVLSKDYIRTARSCGLRERTVLGTNTLRNALPPVAAHSAILFVELLVGTVIVEEVFAVPGLGRYFITSIEQRDYPVIQAIVLLTVVFAIVANLIGEFLQYLLDPRTRHSSAGAKAAV